MVVLYLMPSNEVCNTRFDDVVDILMMQGFEKSPII